MKKYLFLLLFLGFRGMLSAQNLVILNRDGSEQIKNLGSVQNLKFSGSDLIIKSKDGSTVNWPLSGIRKISFTSDVTSTNDKISNTKELIRFFPNPVGNSLHLENLPEGVSGVAIYRMDGTLHLRSVVSPGHSTLDTRELTRGIYLLKIQDQVMKFVKL